MLSEVQVHDSYVLVVVSKIQLFGVINPILEGLAVADVHDKESVYPLYNIFYL
jgi:hypothetical protein